MKVFELSVKADQEAIATLLDWLSDACQQLGLTIDDARRLAILIEELFLNTVNHGYAGQGGPAITYRMSQRDDRSIELVQHDQAAAFDISQATPQQASMDRIGGLGSALIHGMSQSVQYRREGDCNITTIHF